MKLTDEELKQICEQELTASEGYGTDLASERKEAMDAYMGKPLGNEVEERSQVVTREVLDTVEWLLPSLLRTFRDSETICEFRPRGPEDVDAALQETQVLHDLFFNENAGMLALYSFIKDGLLQKNGFLKIYWDDSTPTETEDYKGLNDWELAQLFEGREVEVLEHEMTEEGHDIKILEKSSGKIRIEPCPPEEFGINSDARSINLEDADFIYHRTYVSKAELVSMGYDEDTVRELSYSEGDFDSERLSRRSMSQEQDNYERGDHWSMEKVWLTECYIRIDADGDGNAELMRVVLAGANTEYESGSTLLESEEVDRQPFVTWTPIIRTHAFYGLSIADLVMDIQNIKTTLTRQLLDSTYLANNNRTAVNELVNLPDLLTSRPGGIVRVTGDGPPANSVMPLNGQPVPQQAFEMLSYLDEMRQGRTGVGDQVGALDGSELSQINTGVAALAYDASRSKIELMATLCAQIGIMPLFLRMHELLRKNYGDKQLMVQREGDWIPVRPQEWKDRRDMDVVIGVGRVSRERKIVALTNVLEKQAQVIQLGGMIGPDKIYRALSDYTRELGLEESLYWDDPAKQPPQPEQGPSAQDQAMIMTAQAQMGAAEAAKERNQVEMMKLKSAREERQAELQLKAGEMQMRGQLESMKADRDAMKREMDGAQAGSKAQYEMEIKTRDQEIKLAEMRMQDQQETAKRESEIYRAVLASSTTLTKEQLGTVGIEQASQGVQEEMPDIAGMSAQLAELLARLVEADEKARAPKLVKRDKQGLIIAIGDTPVIRDDSGRVASIG